MGRQHINIGTTVNDGTGDRLRTAMDKVNDNFIEVYPLSFVVQTPVQGNITISILTFKDHIHTITGDSTLNLQDYASGDGGMIEVIISGAGGYTITLGTEWSKKLGTNSLNTAAGKDNFISYRVVGTDVVYTINTV
jgi:hypothetical protein